jgi:GlpG protein
MRVIGTLKSEAEAHRFAAFLKDQGMLCNCEPAFDPHSGHMDYQIWIHDEDRINEASKLFQEFQKNPSDSKYDIIVPPPLPDPAMAGEPKQKQPRTFGTHITTFFFVLCCLIFFLDNVERIPMLEEGITIEMQAFAPTPMEALLLYDIPPAVDEFEKVMLKYENTHPKELPVEVKQELEKIQNMPYWRGFYDWVVLKIKGESTEKVEGPLFVRIREGEIWRLFSPALLHANILHILLNMLGLWILGRPIEMRIGPWRTLLLTLILGIGPNTVQYLMSGPFFLGYSGVLMGFAGFIWMRERVAPWEGYPLDRATILFIVVYIGALLILQVFTFFLQIFTTSSFAPNIANSAHIAGAIFGAYLGRFRYFARKIPS